jgi:hypothetical protein
MGLRLPSWPYSPNLVVGAFSEAGIAEVLTGQDCAGELGPIAGYYGRIVNAQGRAGSGIPAASDLGYGLIEECAMWGMRLVPMLARVVALYNTAGLTSPALSWGRERAYVARSKRALLRRSS